MKQQHEARSLLVSKLIQVLTGAVFRQILLLVSMILVARIYQKEQLGELAIFIATVTIGQNIVFFRNEYRIITEKSVAKCIDSLVCSSVFMLALSGLIGTVYAVWRHDDSYIFLSLLYSICFVLSYGPIILEKALSRLGQYKRLSEMKVGDGLFQASFPATLGVVYPSIFWLVLGRAAGILFSILCFTHFRRVVFFLGILCWRRVRSNKLNLKLLIESIRSNRYLILSGLITSLSVNVPIIAVYLFFTVEDLGSYGTIARLLGVPVSLLGVSISTVFMAESNRYLRESSSGLLKLFDKFSFLAFSLAVVVFVGCLVSDSLFLVVLGSDWSEAGEIAQAMSFHFAMQMFVSPISTIAITLGQTKTQSVFDALRLIILAMCVALTYERGMAEMLYWFSAVSATTYLAYFIFFRHKCKSYEKSA